MTLLIDHLMKVTIVNSIKKKSGDDLLALGDEEEEKEGKE